MRHNRRTIAAVSWAVKGRQSNADGLLLNRDPLISTERGNKMSETKDETVYDRIRREAREKDKQENERQRRFDEWATRDDPQTLEELWKRNGGRQ